MERVMSCPIPGEVSMSVSSVLRLFVDVRKREVEPALLFFFFWFQ